MRYKCLSDHDRKSMMKEIGIKNVDEIYEQSGCNELISNDTQIENHLSEMEVEKRLKSMATKNLSAETTPLFLGAGAYNHHIPAAVDAIIQRSEFLTSYTPYQPEISQGTLQVIFEFQSMVSAITWMEITNASMYDASTSLAESTLMSVRLKKKKNKVILFGNMHPAYTEVTKTQCENQKISVDTYSNLDEIEWDDIASISVQYPDFHGHTNINLNAIRKKCNEIGALLIVVINEVVALGMLPEQKEADIVCGSLSSLGNTLNFGGPGLGFISTKKEFVRQMPGRLAWATTDEEWRRAFALTLNAREQHIRRWKATSNICSNQWLCATAFTVHISMLGEKGFKKLAQLNHFTAVSLAKALEEIPGINLGNKDYFNEFVVQFDSHKAKEVQQILLEKYNIIFGYEIEGNKLIVAATELNSPEDIKKLSNSLKEILAS